MVSGEVVPSLEILHAFASCLVTLQYHGKQISNLSLLDIHRSMGMMTIFEVMWIKRLMKDLSLKSLGSTTLFCDND